MFQKPINYLFLLIVSVTPGCTRDKGDIGTISYLEVRRLAEAARGLPVSGRIFGRDTLLFLDSEVIADLRDIKCAYFHMHTTGPHEVVLYGTVLELTTGGENKLSENSKNSGKAEVGIIVNKRLRAVCSLNLRTPGSLSFVYCDSAKDAKEVVEAINNQKGFTATDAP